jgi:hypothetical protein
MGHELTALADTLEAERAASASGLAETAQARSVVVFPEWVTITPAGR